MKSSIKIYTSYVSDSNFKRCQELGLIPVVIMKKIYNSPVIGHLSDTALHETTLAPDNELLRKFKNNEIDVTDYQKQVAIELSAVNLKPLIMKWERLLSICDGAKGIVLLSYDLDYSISHRKVVSALLNSSGLLENEVYEIG